MQSGTCTLRLEIQLELGVFQQMVVSKWRLVLVGFSVAVRVVFDTLGICNPRSGSDIVKKKLAHFED